MKEKWVVEMLSDRGHFGGWPTHGNMGTQGTFPRVSLRVRTSSGNVPSVPRWPLGRKGERSVCPAYSAYPPFIPAYSAAPSFLSRATRQCSGIVRSRAIVVQQAYGNRPGT